MVGILLKIIGTLVLIGIFTFVYCACVISSAKSKEERENYGKIRNNKKKKDNIK